VVLLSSPRFITPMKSLTGPPASYDRHEVSCLPTRDDLIEWSLMVVFSPLWVPLAAIDAVRERRLLSRELAGGAEAAWARLRQTWSRAQAVYGGSVGANLEAPLEHRLAVAFAKRYPEARALVERGLLDENPYVAAYAFKVLIRLADIELAALPDELLGREDPVLVFLGGCTGEDMPLAQFVRGYFQSSEYQRR
jgi:hypothetical protein